MKPIYTLVALGACLVAALGVALGPVWAEPLSIIGFETGSGMAFEGATVSNYYTLEFAPTVAGPWTNWGSVSGQSITGTVMSLPTPFFYRIRQTDSSAFPPYAPASNIPGSMLADGAITSDKLADNAVNLGGPAVTGTVPDTRLSTNVALLNATQTFSGDNVFAGKVGIGTTTPTHPLVVKKRSVSEPAIMIGGGYRFGPRFQTYGLDETPNAWMGLGTDMSGGAWEHSLYFPGDPAGSQTIGSYDGTSYSEKMRITAAGKVGIGTSAPTEQLDVAGAVKLGTTTNPAPAAGTIRWTGADFQGFNGNQWLSLTMPAPAGMTLVPGGTFIMGSTALGLYEAQSWPDATNFFREHQVTQSPFYIGKYEVTYGVWYSVRQWALINGYNFQNAGREGKNGVIAAAPTSASGEPVTTISWRDCIVWCNARSEKEGTQPVYTYTNAVIRDSRNANAAACDGAVFNTGNNGYRLPTEAEWECAARHLDGDSWTPGDYASGAGFNWSNAVANDVVAWYHSNSSNNLHVVGAKKPNQLGLYDMSGNIDEWCWDWADYYGAGAVTNPVGPSSSPWNYRILRSGSQNYGAPGFCCSTRISYEPSRANSHETGFRYARNAQ